MIETIGLLFIVLLGTFAALVVTFSISGLIISLVWPEGELGIFALAQTIALGCAIVAFLLLFGWAVNYGR